MNDLTTILSSAMRLTAPLAFAGAGEQVAERSGTLNISIEAMMLAGAFFGLLGTSIFGNVAVGFVVGAAAGLAVAVIHANFSHRLNANTFVVGLTLNVLLLGLTSFLDETIDMTPHQAGVIRIPVLRSIPVIGEPLFVNRWPMYLLVVVLPLSYWLVQRTRWGLEVRASGEDPQAADVTGIDVNKRRRQSLYYCGLLAGLGGAYLAIAEVGTFNQNMTAGRGFLVNSAVIFGGWTLKGTMGGCFLFGAADALRLALPALGYTITPQLLIMAPYLLAILAMLFFASRNRKPAALAVAFERGIT
ncbi:MAG TPA: ABC transporter permease [Acidimicrobiales bacterium]|jgi:simple sugar transport system permease protein|nr:ABC transporter permease [Acidimicrobiales bacterium]